MAILSNVLLVRQQISFGTILNLLDRAAVQDAFELSDRLYRHNQSSLALLLKAAALRKLGFERQSLVHLRAARASYRDDILALRLLLYQEFEPAMRVETALDMIADPSATTEDLRRAIRISSFKADRPPLLYVRSAFGSVDGWVSWTTKEKPRLRWKDEVGEGLIHLAEADDLGPYLRRASFSFSHNCASGVQVVTELGNHSITASVAPRREPSAPWPIMADTGVLSVILPVYDDLDVTRRCLDALHRQWRSLNFKLLVVNDASPNASLIEMVNQFCRNHAALFISNSINLGFVGSVNRALARTMPGDVLILNSDVILGRDTLARLKCAAHADALIGTLTPLSNNSALTSFPRLDGENPSLDAETAGLIDEVASRVHGPSVVDVVSNIGFCLYIRQDCLARVGGLSPAYGRGYFEDYEFCLRAAELGFRNVAAPGIYVTHVGGRSFGSEKSKLIYRNKRVIEGRFPGFSERFGHEPRSDALCAARSAIEEALRPDRAVRLVVKHIAGLTAASVLGASSQAEDLVLLWDAICGTIKIRLRASWGGPPQSLRFQLDGEGRDRLLHYLSRWTVQDVRIEEVDRVPVCLREILGRLRRPMTLVVDSREAAMVACGLSAEQPQMMTETVAHHSFAIGGLSLQSGTGLWSASSSEPLSLADKPSFTFSKNKGARSPAVLGIFYPRLDADAERFLHDLSRRFDDSIGKIVVFGQCINDDRLMAVGRIHVTGPVTYTEFAEITQFYKIDAMFSPYRTSLFGLFRAATDTLPLPRIFFEWPGQSIRLRPSDIAIPWTTDIESVRDIIGDHLKGRAEEGLAQSHG